MTERFKALRPIFLALVAAAPLLGCGRSDGGQRFTPTGEERTVQGKVVDTELTLCAPAPDKPGTCEGRMVVEPPGGGEAVRVALEVTRDVALRKGQQTLFLPSLRGTEVTATYRATTEGPNLATSVAVTP